MKIYLLQVGERIRVILDCDDNTLAFERNYEFLGVAFRGIEFNSVIDKFRLKNNKVCCAQKCTNFFSIIGLPDKRLYPSISAVYGNTEVSMVYLGPPLDG